MILSSKNFSGEVVMLQNVLVCGWGDSTFMITLLHGMDAELPKNSQITLLNLQRKEDVLGEPLGSHPRPSQMHLFPLARPPNRTLLRKSLGQC
jgi:hypothetical protein